MRNVCDYDKGKEQKEVSVTFDRQTARKKVIFPKPNTQKYSGQLFFWQ